MSEQDSTPLEPPISVPSTPIEKPTEVPAAPVTEATMPLLEAFYRFIPEMSNPDAYPTEMVKIYVRMSASELSEKRWGDHYAFGVALLTAHRLCIRAQAINADGTINADAGRGIASRSIGPASLTYYSTSSDTGDDAYYSSTWYGREYLRLAKIMGIGLLQL